MITDTGARRAFDTGAIRDIDEKKGRCDLLPLDVIAEMMAIANGNNPTVVSDQLIGIDKFIRSGDAVHLLHCATRWCENHYNTGVFSDDGFVKGSPYSSVADAMLYLSHHFKEGAMKYGERNWEKGIPTHCYIDSAIRHLLKYEIGLADESHDKAYLWNIICCIWTMTNKPQNDDIYHELQEEEISCVTKK